MILLVSALLILLACLVYGGVHSWLASLSLKQQLRNWLGGGFIDRYYRLLYNLFGVFSLLPVLALPAFLPDQPLYRIPFPFVLVSLAVQGIAVLALLIGLLQTGVLRFLGISQIFNTALDREDRLVIQGLYRWVRHPLYTAGLIFIWFSPVMTVNLLVLFLGLSAYLVIGAYFEERKLLRIFGESYARYRQNTPMLIPRPGKRVF